jgi:hypothetical protein
MQDILKQIVHILTTRLYGVKDVSGILVVPYLTSATVAIKHRKRVYFTCQRGSQE